MKTYFTSDPHFGHLNMTEAGKDLCKRGFADVPTMNEALIDGINSTVNSKSRLIILGDLCMGKLEDSLPYLGRIEAAEVVLLPGNHDRWSNAYHHKGKDADVKRAEWMVKYQKALPGGGVVFKDCKPSGWHGLFSLTGEWDTPEIFEDVWFSHFPYVGDSHGEDRYAEFRVKDDGETPIIHGHVHEEWKINGRQFNVGVDVNDFKPVSDTELADWLRSL